MYTMSRPMANLFSRDNPREVSDYGFPRSGAPDKKLKGKIVDEVERGYMLKEKVIRYTKVVVGE